MDFLWNSSGSDSDDAWMALQQLRAHQMQHQPTTDRAAFAPRQMKRRKIETKPRAARYGHLHPKGDQRRRILNHENSSWWELIHHPDVFDPTSSTGKKFRRIFRLPWSEVQMLLALADRKPKWAGKTAGRSHRRGHARKPLILKVLAALRHVAKGHDNESLEAESGVSASVLKTFIPAFLKWLASELFEQHVRTSRGEELKKSTAILESLRFPGCMCECDGVHLHWDKAPAKHRALYVVRRRVCCGCPWRICVRVFSLITTGSKSSRGPVASRLAAGRWARAGPRPTRSAAARRLGARRRPDPTRRPTPSRGSRSRTENRGCVDLCRWYDKVLLLIDLSILTRDAHAT